MIPGFLDVEALLWRGVNYFLNTYILVYVVAPLLGVIAGVYITSRIYRDASAILYFVNISFWTFFFEIFFISLSIYLLILPPIRIPGVNPVYLFTAMLILAAVTGTISFIIGFRRSIELSEEPPPSEEELEGEEAIHVMIIGDEPHELPPDERSKISDRE